jgi:hypothetical protein
MGIIRQGNVFLFDTVRILILIMSQFVKTKRQANFKDLKRFGAFKGLVEQKNVVFNSFVCKLGLFWHAWAILKRE